MRQFWSNGAIRKRFKTWATLLKKPSNALLDADMASKLSPNKMLEHAFPLLLMGVEAAYSAFGPEVLSVRSKNGLFLTAMSLLLLVVPGFARAEAKKVAAIEGITEYRLDNGLEVLLFPDPSTS